ncbi:MAG: hypothetical protein LBC89_01975, partial [Bacteroidales bacterium]|nr:hypothetical protein [Bacteroidales bacterium]
MKRFIIILILSFVFTRAFATHQRAAEITFQLLESSTYTYQISLVTYTYQASLADRPEQIIYLGYENKFDTLVRYATDTIPGAQIVTNYYKKNHTFPGPGTYIVSMTDANRNNGIINVPNSVNTPMYVESMLIISPFLSPPNSSPILLTKPIDEGCVGIPFVHNPGAFDIDGDQLRYSLIPCKTENGINIPGYAMPAAS